MSGVVCQENRILSCVEKHLLLRTLSSGLLLFAYRVNRVGIQSSCKAGSGVLPSADRIKVPNMDLLLVLWLSMLSRLMTLVFKTEPLERR